MKTASALTLLLLCSGTLAAFTPAPAPPAPPAPPAAAPDNADDAPGSMTFTTVDGGKATTIVLKNGKITEATIDGKKIDPKNIETSDRYFTFKDDSGKTITRIRRNVVGPEARELAALRLLGDARAPGQRGGRGWGGAWFDGSERPPTVMMGITMSEPDGVIADHFDIDPSASTQIGSVSDGLPAAKAGLKRGDIIVAIDGKAPADPTAIRKAVSKKNPGDTIAFTVIQKGEKKDLTLTLEAYDRKKLNPRADADNDFDHDFDGEEMERNIREAIEQSMMDAEGARGAGERARAAAERARALAERLRERMPRGMLNIAPVAPLTPMPPDAQGRAGTFLIAPRGDELNEQMAELEERLGKLEELLDRLAGRLDEKLDKLAEKLSKVQPGGGGNAKPPVDESDADELDIALEADDELSPARNDEEPVL